ncbi:hypothetical protein BDW59DRAFT_166827 [Aspergillus cavernicola]|uniref:DUF7025 domain-containing protein n=1 Tax=Aspergillus cavernicola TaxID=176166 RepID=A0ABR4HIV6_9EURO
MSSLTQRYIYILNCDGYEPSLESEETIILAEELQDNVEAITNIRRDHISTAKKMGEDAVVNRLYIHLRQTYISFDEPDYRLTNFLRHIEFVFGPEYTEEDSLFAEGCVRKSHLAKLFRRNGIIVTHGKDHPRAYKVVNWSYWRYASLMLPCVTWSFNGEFFQESKELKLEWSLGDDEKVSIRELGVYPLRFNEEIRSRLIERGINF